MFEELSDTSRVYQQKIQQTKTMNYAMVELCQQLTETNQEQGNKIIKLITYIEAITKILVSNGHKAPPQEEYKKQRTKIICKLCGQFHNNPNFLWELEKNSKNRPTTKQNKQDNTVSWTVVNKKRSTKSTDIRNKLENNSNTSRSKYWTLLTSKVEALANITRKIDRIEKVK